MLRRRRQRGLSIVELMVGIAVGLFVVAAAAMLVAGQLSSNRRLLLDTQIQQDLRAATEFISRELRRAGSMNNTEAVNRIWRFDATTNTLANFYAANMTPTSGETNNVYYEYNRNGVTEFGFDLNQNRIRTRIEGQYQDITDATVMKVTDFKLTVTNEATVQLVCPTECSGGGNACWPSILVRDIDIEITAQAANDPTIVRSSKTSVRLRNDFVKRGPGITSNFCPT